MTPLPKRATGEGAAVAAINRMLDNIQERTPLDSSTVRIERLANRGFRLHVNAGVNEVKSEPIDIAQFRVREIHADHLICDKLSDDLQSVVDDTIQVAKPFDLRASTWAIRSGGDTVLGVPPFSVDGREYTMVGNNDNGATTSDWRQRSYTRRIVKITGVPFDEGTDPANDTYSNPFHCQLVEQVVPAWSKNHSVIVAVKFESPIIEYAEILGVTGFVIHEGVSCEWLSLTDRQWQPIYHQHEVCREISPGVFERNWVLIRSSLPFDAGTADLT